jgi:hypothetical protein
MLDKEVNMVMKIGKRINLTRWVDKHMKSKKESNTRKTTKIT